MVAIREKKKYYFVVRTTENDIVNLVSKGKDKKEAKIKLLVSLKNEILEVLSVSEHYPKTEVVEKSESPYRKNQSRYMRDKSKKRRKFFC